jgi:hypothetical protein
VEIKITKKENVVFISQQTRGLISDIQCSELAIVCHPILCSVSLKEKEENGESLLPLFALRFMSIVTAYEI